MRDFVENLLKLNTKVERVEARRDAERVNRRLNELTEYCNQLTAEHALMLAYIKALQMNVYDSSMSWEKFRELCAELSVEYDE